MGGETHPPMKGSVMKKYKVRIETPGKVIFFKNRKIRTPFVLELTEGEVKLFHMTMTSHGIEKYEIEEIKQNTDEDVWEEVITKDKEVVIEELYSNQDFKEPSTILEKLLADEKNGEK